mmetsp:Transcript_21189/g.59644  ORF Transcript_21189/g.59644 Transcript_21189/m.59644 type:complete len:354 (+) Transcript_21189:222-1283(+)
MSLEFCKAVLSAEALHPQVRGSRRFFSAAPSIPLRRLQLLHGIACIPVERALQLSPPLHHHPAGKLEVVVAPAVQMVEHRDGSQLVLPRDPARGADELPQLVSDGPAPRQRPADARARVAGGFRQREEGDVAWAQLDAAVVDRREVGPIVGEVEHRGRALPADLGPPQRPVRVVRARDKLDGGRLRGGLRLGLRPPERGRAPPLGHAVAGVVRGLGPHARRGGARGLSQGQGPQGPGDELRGPHPHHHLEALGVEVAHRAVHAPDGLHELVAVAGGPRDPAPAAADAGAVADVVVRGDGHRRRRVLGPHPEILEEVRRPAVGHHRAVPHVLLAIEAPVAVVAPAAPVLQQPVP